MRWQYLTQHLVDQFVVELVVPGGNGRVGREHAEVTDALGVPDKVLVPDLLDIAFVFVEQFDGQKARVSLVHVVFLYLELQGAEHAHPADAEHGLLLEPVARVAPVEPVGKDPVIGMVILDIGVQKEDGQLPPGHAFLQKEPGLYINRTSFKLNGHPVG